jgi:Galactose oxidase, central domain
MKNAKHVGKLPCPVGDAAGVVVDDRLLVFGGATGEECCDSIVAIAGTGACSITGKLPVRIRGHQAAVVGPSVFLFGGFDGRKTLSQTLRYDLQSGRVSEMPPIPSDLAWFSAVTFGRKVILVGGFSIPGGYSDTMHVFDAAAGEWSKIGGAFPRRLFARERLGSSAAAVHNGRIYTFGGADAFDGETMTANALGIAAGFDLESRQWRPFPASCEPREGIVAASDRRNTYLIGGMQEKPRTASAAIERVDFKRPAISTVGRMQTARVAPAAGIIQGALVIAGGVTDPPFKMTDSIEVFPI